MKFKRERNMNISDFFDKIYVINLPERVDRRREMEKEIKSIGLNFNSEKVKIFPAIKPTEKLAFPSIGVLGCYLSHLEIIKIAKTDKLSHILVMEDDLAISSRFCSVQTQLLDELSQVNWDLLFLGYLAYNKLKLSDYYNFYDPDISTTWTHLKKANYPTLGTHFYAVNHTAYDSLILFLEELLKKRFQTCFFEKDPNFDDLDGAYIDTAYYLFRKQNPEIVSLIVCPSLGWQRSSPSDISPRMISSSLDKVVLIKPLVSFLRLIKLKLKKTLDYLKPELFDWWDI